MNNFYILQYLRHLIRVDWRGGYLYFIIVSPLYLINHNLTESTNLKLLSEFFVQRHSTNLYKFRSHWKIINREERVCLSSKNCPAFCTGGLS